nr:Hypothetical protein CBG12432 [Haemonchus contortus]
MEWTSTALAHYTGTLNALYSKPLIEHCTKTKVADDQSSGKTSKSAEMEKLADGTNMTAKDDHDQLVARLREAASRVTQWGSQGEQVMNVKNKEVTLAEMAAMYRLKTLISISANLVELITRVKTWSKENSKLIEKCRTRNVLPMTMNMFEATCAIGEIFKLKSIDRSGTREDFQQFLREQSQNEYTSEANTSLVIANPRDYIPPLECRINHYRTCVNLIGSSLITIIQTYMNSIPLEQIDIKTREVKEVLERLPSMYMRIQANLSSLWLLRVLQQRLLSNAQEEPLKNKNHRKEQPVKINDRKPETRRRKLKRAANRQMKEKAKLGKPDQQRIRTTCCS